MSNDDKQPTTYDPTPLREGAERALADALGAPVGLEVVDALREGGRNRVARFRVTDGPDGAPETVVAKANVGDDEHPYDPEDDALGSNAWRFYNEWSSGLYLGGLGAEPPFAARVLGGSRGDGLIVLDDLGPPYSLADQMQGGDRAALETGLLTYAATLGRLHAATAGAGQEAEFTRMRLAVGGTETAREREGVRWLRENVEPFGKLCEALGVTTAPGFDADVEAVRAAVDDPGPYLAFAPCDTCPDNHKLMPGGSLRFFDFEFSGFRHALLDASYFRVPFPTCWCVNRLPEAIGDRMEAAYRAELVRGCPEAGDDGAFAAEMARACAYWLLSTVTWGWEKYLAEDHRWGLASVRQRHLMRLENFAALSARTGEPLPAIAETARALRDTLHARWSADLEPMPLYAPFRGEAS